MNYAISIKMPEAVSFILYTLHKNNFKAYAVGGCIRDSLLNNVPSDWDITTDARPEQVDELFEHVAETGIDFGTVSVLIDGIPYEVTTFRKEGRYSDGRHPDKVSYETELIADVSRRDLTINSLAYNDEEGIVDYTGGLNDLYNGIIRFVGRAEDRLNEDPLRALRALRFAARYGFRMSEEDRAMAVKVFTEKHRLVSNERIHDEINKFFSSCHGAIDYGILDTYVKLLATEIPEIEEMYPIKQVNPHHIYDLYNHTLHVVQYTSQYNDPIICVAALLHDIGKPDALSVKNDVEHFYNHARYSAEKSRRILSRLKFSNAEIKDIVYLVANHDMFMDNFKMRTLRKAMAGVSLRNINRLKTIKLADNFAQAPMQEHEDRLVNLFSAMDEVINDGSAITLRELKLNGNDVLNLNIQHPENIKQVLNDALSECWSYPEHNNKAWLMAHAEKFIKRNNL